MLPKLALTAVALIGLASSAQAGVVFSDNFDLENGGVANGATLNYNSFTQWTVDRGTVDLIGNGYFDFLPGNGLYVDMDGSTGNAGRMYTGILSLGPGVYDLSFDLAGNRRTHTPEVVQARVHIGVFAENFSLPATAPFTTYTRSFTLSAPQNVRLSFEGFGGDNVGMLLDNVELRAVPLPPAAWMGLAGLAALGLIRRRRRST